MIPLSVVMSTRYGNGQRPNIRDLWSLGSGPGDLRPGGAVTACRLDRNEHGGRLSWSAPTLDERQCGKRRFDLVSDFATGIRLGSVIVVPASLILAVLGPPLALALLSWGSNTENNAYFLGLLFSVFTLGLVPYMLFQLLLRVYYSLHDSKTPALIGVATMIASVACNYLALALLPPADTILALAAGFGVSNIVGVMIAWPSLSRRLGGLGGREIGRSLLRMHAAALPAALFALNIAVVIGTKDGTTFLPDRLASAFTVAAGGAGALMIYWLFAKATHLTELTDLLASVRSRLGR